MSARLRTITISLLVSTLTLAGCTPSAGPPIGSAGASGGGGGGSGGSGTSQGGSGVPGGGGSPGSGGASGSGGGSSGPDRPDSGSGTGRIDAAGSAGGGSRDAGRLDTAARPGGSTIDPVTSLTWQNEINAPRTNVGAAKLCDDLMVDGFSDWRVPAPEELATWPALKPDSNAYITSPTYIPSNATPADGCTGNAHSCNLTQYNAGATSCAWQGVGFTGKFVCVRGSASAGTTVDRLAAGACEACRTHVTGAAPEFKAASCLPFAR